MASSSFSKRCFPNWIELAVALPNTMFANNRKKFLAKFKEKVTDAPKNSLLFFKGKEEMGIDSTGI